MHILIKKIIEYVLNFKVQNYWLRVKSPHTKILITCKFDTYKYLKTWNRLILMISDIHTEVNFNEKKDLYRTVKMEERRLPICSITIWITWICSSCIWRASTMSGYTRGKPRLSLTKYSYFQGHAQQTNISSQTDGMTTSKPALLYDAIIVNIAYNSTAPNIGLKLNMDRMTLKC